MSVYLGQRLLLLSRSKAMRKEADQKFKYAEKEHKARMEEQKKKLEEAQEHVRYDFLKSNCCH